MAGGKGNTFINDFLKLVFNATAIANIADNASVSPLGNLYVSMHTASPNSAGNQTSSEATYGGYARQAVPRNGTGWTVSGQTVTLTSQVNFPPASSGSETENYFGVGTALSGTGKLLYFGTLSPSVVVTSGVTPQLLNATSITEA